MVITYTNIRSTSNKLLKAFFIECFGLYGRTTVKELLQRERELGLNLAITIYKQLGLSGIAQTYYIKEKKLHKFVKFRFGRAVKYLVYYKNGMLINTGIKK
ncbi:MAG: hypothetical protein KQ78_02114 [Candidatus Izimaplasma bacterium HR2]|nr:MAG: hypothetical protein KQ78_02114 [Candidatus Izimaplasma bacterium HR2]